MISAETKFKQDVNYRIYRLKHLAKKYSWELISHHKSCLKFKRTSYADINSTIFINYSSWEIDTVLNHPSKGITQLSRTGNFTVRLIEEIFKNPRTHMPLTIKSKYVQLSGNTDLSTGVNNK